MAKQFEGTWEEILSHASEFDGCRVQVTLVEERTKAASAGPSNGSRSQEVVGSELLPGVIPGRQHGKPYKEWRKEIGATDISPEEFDAFERAIAENREMRRALALDRKD